VRQEHHKDCNHHVLFITTGKAETGNHDLQEKLEKYVILLTKVVSGVFFFHFQYPIHFKNRIIIK